MATTRRNGETIERYIDYVDVTPREEFNPDWTFTDPTGHIHNAKSNSLVAIEDMEATDEYPSVWHYECRECGAHIPKGAMTRSVKFKQYMVGTVHERVL